MFGIFKVYSDAKKGVRDPAGFGKELALDLIKAPLILFTFLGAVFLTIMAVLGFTGLIGGPYLFFKIIFWLLLIPFALFEIIGWSVYRKLEKLAERAKQKINEKIIDAEIHNP